MEKQIYIGVISGVLTLAAFEFVARPFLEKIIIKSQEGSTT